MSVSIKNIVLDIKISFIKNPNCWYFTDGETGKDSLF